MPLTDHQKAVIEETRQVIRNQSDGYGLTMHDAIGVVIAAQLIDLNGVMESISYKLDEIASILRNR